MFTYCTKHFFYTDSFKIIKKPSVSERGDMDLVNHGVVIWNNGLLCRINSIKKEKLMGTVQYIIKAVIDFINN